MGKIYVALLMECLTLSPEDISDLTQAQLYEMNQVRILVRSHPLHP